MVGIAEITAGYEGAKVALDIAKGMRSLKGEAAVNSAVIEIQRNVLEAQQGLSASLKRIEELQSEIARLKDWSADKTRYELVDTGQGSLAYQLKDGAQPAEPSHYICPQCYQESQKSILKHETLPVGRAHTLVCHRCGYDIVTRGVRPGPPVKRAGSFGR